ncbi:hypothetical protein ZIOFF_026121 [Zingiber officinale]|uniref:Uncharacterized protein n=1 Tax=Zingiber officinale TaxID=94328 RepID=A0A8J5GVC3_ZINOF|nr:hypothetical protein ZIOFF_026121 [Zingiber officinale]
MISNNLKMIKSGIPKMLESISLDTVTPFVGTALAAWRLAKQCTKANTSEKDASLLCPTKGMLEEARVAWLAMAQLKSSRVADKRSIC